MPTPGSSPANPIFPGVTPTSSYAGNAGSSSANPIIPGVSQQGVPQPNAAGNYGTTTANISNPSSTATNPAPAVITSNAAQTDLANKQNQVNTLNTDTANHQAIVNAGNAPAPDATDTSSSTSTATPASGGSSLDDQVNSILSGFNTNVANIESSGADAANKYGQAAATAQAQLDTAAQSATSQLNAIAQGAYPLSPAESSILNATTAQYQQAIQYQQQANASYTGQMTEAMASLGIETSAPTEAFGMINSAISTGSSKIADLNSSMAVALGNLQLGFQKQDFDMVQSAWDETSKYMEDRVSTLTTMQKNIQDATNQQVTELQSQTQMNLSTINQSATFDLTQKQDMINDAYQQQQITETQRHDLATEAISAETAAKGTYSFNADTGEVFNTATGQMVGTGTMGVANGTVTPGQTGVPILDNNTKTTSTGVPYIDGTNLKGAQASEAQIEAAKLGIPFLGATQATAAGKIDTTRENLQNIQTELANLSPKTPIGQVINLVGNPVSQVLNTGNGPELNAYGGYSNAAIQAITSLAGAGSGNRITQTEVQNMLKNIPNPNDTQATAKAKIAVLQGMLTNSEKNLFGTSVYDTYNSDSATADLQSYAAVSPAHQQQVQQIHSSYPDLTPNQVLQLVQP